ncbi:MAG: polysaccharide pyruvyl transferase family protein [Cyanobacteriota bacterium]
MDYPKMTILLLNDNSYINNFGCQATMSSLIRMVANAAPEQKLITVEQRDLAKDYYQEIPPAKPSLRQLKKYVKRAKNTPRIAEYFPKTANDFQRYGEMWQRGDARDASEFLLPLLSQSDLVIHNAELLNYKTNKISLRGAFLLWYAKTYLNKKVALINQTTPAPGSDLVMEGILEYLCPYLDLVTAREPRSNQLLQSLGFESQLVPDPVFSISPDLSKQDQIQDWLTAHTIKSPYICLSFISVLASNMNQNHSLHLFTTVISAIQEKGFQVILMDAGSGSLRKINQTLKEITGAFVFDGNYTEFWSLLKSSSALVSGHYHNIIMAAQVGCPFVPMRSVSHKVESLCELLDWKITPLNPTCLELSIEKMLEGIDITQNQLSELSEYLLNRTQQLQSESRLTESLLAHVMKP